MAEILLYDAIGNYFGEFSAKGFATALAAVPRSERITLRINSPGGDVFEALAIYNQAKNHAGGVDVVIDGLAASAASLIAMVGQRITIAEGAMLMIHLPWAGAVGTAEDMRRVAELLDKIVEDSNLPIYAGRTGQTPEQIRDWLIAETWLSAAEAVQFGFADAIDPVTAKPAPAAATERLAANWKDRSKIAALVKAREKPEQASGRSVADVDRELTALAWDLEAA